FRGGSTPGPRALSGGGLRPPDSGRFPVGAPPPYPGVRFPRRKSTQKGDKRERDFDFPLPLITPSPLNDQRGGVPPLWIRPPAPAGAGLAFEGAVKPLRQETAPSRGPSGEAGYPLYRLRGASRPAEIQWQPGIFSDGV